ncbi:MAG: hypothetical protein IJB15_00295, partial [Clostridia bacterium]|nr:hypothetical protein [Clostridia bacterium]
SAAGQVEVYRFLGYTGICITDHFFGGSNNIPPDIPWEEKIRHLVSGYEHAVQAAGADLDVFLGWEYTLGGGSDFLILGLDTDWLLRYPDQLKWKPAEYFTKVREDGGFVIHAHPFRRYPYPWIDTIKLMPWHIDGVEGYNASNEDDENDMALQYAAHYHLPIYGGSDNHEGRVNRYAGIEADRRYENIADLLRTAASHPEWIFCRSETCPLEMKEI